MPHDDLKHGQLRFNSGERQVIDLFAEKLFLRKLTEEDYARLFGAVGGAKIDVGYCDDAILVDFLFQADVCISMVMSITGNNDDIVFCFDSVLCFGDFAVAERVMHEIINLQIRTAREFGIRHMTVQGAEISKMRASCRNTLVSIDWSKYGFDAFISDDFLNELPPELQWASLLSELLDDREGNTLWRQTLSRSPMAGSLEWFFDLEFYSRCARVYVR